MNILSDKPVVLIKNCDLSTHDHSKENQTLVNSDQTSISPEKSPEINFDVSIAASAKDVPTPTVPEIDEFPTLPTVPNLEEVSSAKSQRTNPHLKKKQIPCPFIVRCGWCIKREQCDFSHSKLVNNLELLKPVKQKSAVFCPFLRKKGYCLKESRCDFSHRSLQKPQSPSFSYPYCSLPPRPVNKYITPFFHHDRPTVASQGTTHGIGANQFPQNYPRRQGFFQLYPKPLMDIPTQPPLPHAFYNHPCYRTPYAETLV